MKGPALPRVKHATINEALAAAAQTALGLVFVDAAERETRLPWARVYTGTRHTAEGLRRLSVCPGERVAMLLPT